MSREFDGPIAIESVEHGLPVGLVREAEQTATDVDSGAAVLYEVAAQLMRRNGMDVPARKGKDKCVIC